MKWSREILLEKFLASDASWNGRFLTGVVTTGIYCLPSCTARKPRPENVRFFEKGSEAEQAGLRPCLRCRPDDFAAGRDPDFDRVAALASRLEAEPGGFPDAPSLARAAGVGSTKLHELFLRHFHETPAAFLHRARVDAVARLLAGSRQPLLDCALDAGFESASTFHAAFRKRMALSPGDYRKLVDHRSFVLELPGDFRSGQALSSFWGRDSESPVERAEGNRLATAFRADGLALLLSIELKDGAARVEVARNGSGALSVPAMVAAHRTALRILGLAGDPAPFERRARLEPDVARLIAGRRGLRIPLSVDPFDALARAVLGQVVSLAVAAPMRRALARLAGEPVGSFLVHPDAAAVARLDREEMVRAGIQPTKADRLLGLSRRIASGELVLDGGLSLAASGLEKRLGAEHGLGPWSVGYVLLRGYGFADAVPAGDSALSAALVDFSGTLKRPDARATRTLLEPFAPHRSFAVAHLWTSVSKPAPKAASRRKTS